MKKTIIFLLVAFCMILLHSCSTSQKVTVHGVPGTEIYSPTMDRLGVVGSNGKASLKISRDTYYSYLMSKNARANEFVPFALDYKHCNNTLAATVSYIGTVTALTGVLVGGISLAVGGDTPEITGVGAAMLGTGLLMAIPSNYYYKKTHGDNQFKYLNNQRTNQDFSFLPIKDTGYDKTSQNDENKYLATSTSKK